MILLSFISPHQTLFAATNVLQDIKAALPAVAFWPGLNEQLQALPHPLVKLELLCVRLAWKVLAKNFSSAVGFYLFSPLFF